MHRLSTLRLSLIVCVALALLPGCMSGCDTGWISELETEEPTCVSADAYNPGYDQTIVFVDASGSAAQEAILDHYERELNRLVTERVDEGKHCEGGEVMAQTGDRLHLFPIHEKTISKAGRWDIENSIDPPDWSQFEGTLDNNRMQVRSRISQFVSGTQEEVPSRVSRIVESSDFSGATDIWGSLQVIGDEVDPGASSVRVVYLSDMFEAVGGAGRRNFESRLPATLDEARGWAQEDVAEHLNAHINLTDARMEALSQVDMVRVVPGPLATKDGAPRVQVYWETLFQELGVQQIEYN